jgi:hypothetical protein
VIAPSMDDREIRSALGAARQNSDSGRGGANSRSVSGAARPDLDGGRGARLGHSGDGCSALDRRQRPRCRRTVFDPSPALRAQIGLFGEGRHVPVGQVGLWNRRERPRCRRAYFDPRSALRARIRLGKGGCGCGWIVPGLSSPALSRSLWAGSTRVPIELC